MDISEIAKKLGLSDSKILIRKASELCRLCDVQFDSSIIGVGEVAKAIICMEIAERLRAASFRKIVPRKDDKWWLPVPCVLPGGLSEKSRKHLIEKRDCANKIHKAAMAINSNILAEIDIPETYIDDLPKVCEWKTLQKDIKLVEGDYVVHLDLITKVRGLNSAEKFFKDLPDKMRGQPTCTALLHAYVQNDLVDKSEALVAKMSECGFMRSPLPYNHVMSLYISKGKLDKLFVLSFWMQNTSEEKY